MRRGAAFAVTLVIHALLIAGLLRVSADRERSTSTRAERRSVLTLLEIPRAEAPQPVQSERTTTQSTVDQEKAEPTSTAITVPPAPAPANPSRVDWGLEAERAALDHIEAATRAKPRPFGPPQTAEENSKPPEFEWDPEPKRTGFAGGLPYVRLGKRCVVGLGFFGCAIGELPEPNGELFEGMHDPNRHESSVPDPPR